MALSYKARRRWSLFVLLVGLPVYVVLVVSVMSSLARLPFVVELIAYVALGVGGFLPLKFIFKGVGQADPNASTDDSSKG